jgi:hypothetical protein
VCSHTLAVSGSSADGSAARRSRRLCLSEPRHIAWHVVCCMVYATWHGLCARHEGLVGFRVIDSRLGAAPAAPMRLEQRCSDVGAKGRCFGVALPAPRPPPATRAPWHVPPLGPVERRRRAVATYRPWGQMPDALGSHFWHSDFRLPCERHGTCRRSVPSSGAGELWRLTCRTRKRPMRWGRTSGTPTSACHASAMARAAARSRRAAQASSGDLLAVGANARCAGVALLALRPLPATRAPWHVPPLGPVERRRRAVATYLPHGHFGVGRRT